MLSESINADAFKTAWGNPANLTVVTATTAPSGLGLGMGDALVLFDATGKTVAWFNYKLTDITTALPEAKVLTPSVAADGITRTAAHAGPSFGATGTLVTTSAVWDGVSVISPKYKAAISGELGAFTSGALIGSPGQ